MMNYGQLHYSVKGKGVEVIIPSMSVCMCVCVYLSLPLCILPIIKFTMVRNDTKLCEP